MDICDVIIIGGGPAGLTAAIYAAREKEKVILMEKGVTGGRACEAEHIDNYPGFPEGIGGMELTQLMFEQANKFGLEYLTAEVINIELGQNKKVLTNIGDFASRALIICGGSEKGRLNVPGEAELTGKGVSYCATCDGPLFSGRPVAVIGGGSIAVNEALHLARFASKVFVVHRGNKLRAPQILIDKAMQEPNIEVLTRQAIEAVEGTDKVTGLKLKNLASGESFVLQVDGVFVAVVSNKPNTAYLKGILDLDDSGYIIVDERMQTSIKGVFAAGDIRRNSIKQVVAACGDGAVAAFYAREYLK